METKFNFHDIVGYIIPGAANLGLFSWFSLSILGLSSPIELGNFGGIILFVGASYPIGHLIQVLGNFINDLITNKWGGQFSEQFLRDDNEHYTAEFKENVKRFAHQFFGLSFDVDKKIQAKRRQEIFHLCYSLIVIEKVAIRTEIFNSVCMLHRGLLGTLCIGIIVSAAITVKHIGVILATQKSIPLLQAISGNYELKIGFIALVFFIILFWPVVLTLRRFSKHFANSVYRNFYVWYKKKEAVQ